MKSFLLILGVLILAQTSFAEGFKWLDDDQENMQARVDLIEQAKEEIVAGVF